MSIRDYKITDEQFNEKGMTSLPDTLKGTPYENKRSLEKFTREVVAPQFNSIVDTFADMEESAKSWSAEEMQRVQQENARQTAEQGRASMEGQRETNETARLLAEENRISAENDRVTAETARVNAENKRDSAEKSRVAAENARNSWQTYDASKAYVPGNKVSFGGSSYVCTAATTGHAPTDAAYWLLIAQKGEDGAGADDLRQINDALDAVDPTKITAKAAPADGDGVMIADSADGGKAKRLLWSSVKTALGKLFVPLARKINGKTLSKDVTLTGDDIAMGADDAESLKAAMAKRLKETANLQEKDANSILAEGRYFAINCANTPEHGFLEVKYYDGNGFAPTQAWGRTRVISQTLKPFSECYSYERYGLIKTAISSDVEWSDWIKTAINGNADVHDLAFSIPVSDSTSQYERDSLNHVFVRIRAKTDTNWNGETIIGVMPEGFRPAKYVAVPMMIKTTANAFAVAQCTISPSGNIRAYGDFRSVDHIAAQLTYPAAD